MQAQTATPRRKGSRKAGTLRERASARAGCRATPDSSARRRAVLPDRWDLDRAEELYLGLERDAELLARTPARLGDQRNRIHGPSLAGVLDEVRMLGRDLGAADAEAAEAAGLEHPPRSQLVLRVLEHAAKGALVRRLRVLPLLLHPGDDPLDLGDRPRRPVELRRRDHLTRFESRAPVAEPELGGRAPLG